MVVNQDPQMQGERIERGRRHRSFTLLSNPAGDAWQVCKKRMAPPSIGARPDRFTPPGSPTAHSGSARGRFLLTAGTLTCEAAQTLLRLIVCHDRVDEGQAASGDER